MLCDELKEMWIDSYSYIIFACLSYRERADGSEMVPN